MPFKVATIEYTWIQCLFSPAEHREKINKSFTDVSEINIVQVPYLPSSRTQTQNVMKLLHGRTGCLADLGSGDGRLVRLKHIFM